MRNVHNAHEERSDGMQQLINFFNDNFYNLCIYSSVLYIPVRIFYKNVFSFLQACGFVCGIATPIMYIYLIGDDKTVGNIAMGILVSVFFIIIGLLCLFAGWTNCKNIIHAILMPVAMVCEVFAFILVLTLFIIGLAVATQDNAPPYSIRRDDDDDY